MSTTLKVSRDQVIALKSKLWPAACRVREWDVKDREFQMTTLSEILGRRIESSNDIGRVDEFTKVKLQLEAWSQPGDLHRAVRTIRNPRRVLEYKVMNDQAALLAVLNAFEQGREIDAPDQLTVEDHSRAEHYITELMRSRFRTEDITQVSEVVKPRFRKDAQGQWVPTGQEKSDLECLRDTLDARISALRRGTPWSWHDLRMRAGVPCECATFCRDRATARPASREEVAA